MSSNNVATCAWPPQSGSWQKNADPFVKHLPQIEEGDLTLILSFVFCPENIADYICYIYSNEFQTTFIMVAMSPDHEWVYKSKTLIKLFQSLEKKYKTYRAVLCLD